MKKNNQKGFTLIQAVFILVVLGLLGMVMVRLIGVQTSTGVLALQGTRAYHAARSGLEWGAARASSVDRTVDPCDETICTAVDDGNIDGRLPIDNFKVAVSCTCKPFDEGSPDGEYGVYSIESTATLGSYGSPDYISRKVEMKVGFP